jgi:hypothetical protein
VRGDAGREERAERTLWYVSTHRSERWRIVRRIASQAALFQRTRIKWPMRLRFVSK